MNDAAVFTPEELAMLPDYLRMAETYSRDTARTLDHKWPESPLVERLRGYAEGAALLRQRLEAM